MLVKRLYLRNFRVYEAELDLDVPPGLVGIYGPNGAGKSTLLEAILWTLFGRSRTTKEQIRSSGVNADCVTEVEFEHEGHLYLVRRTIRGSNSTVAVEAHCDNALMSSGTRDAQRYVESVLGMDDAAFRASVFTEQKQLAAFSSQPPGERRKLVLQLLGITPLDGARDAARKDARDLSAAHEKVKGLLVDLSALQTEADDYAAAAEAAQVVASTESAAAEAAETSATAATGAFEVLDRQRQEYDALCLEGKAARHELDNLVSQAEELRRELDDLATASGRLDQLEPLAQRAERLDTELRLLVDAAGAAAAVASAPAPEEPPPYDESARREAQAAAVKAREDLAGVEALLGAATGEVERARAALSRSSSLTGEADCPVCGQALGDAYETVQEHRAVELADAEGRLKALRRDKAAAARRTSDTAAELRRLEIEAEQASARRAAWEQALTRSRAAADSLAAAWAAVTAEFPARAAPRPPSAAALTAEAAAVRDLLASARAARGEADRLRGKLERRPVIEAALGGSIERRDTAQGRVEALREKVRALAFDKSALDRAAEARTAAANSWRDSQVRAGAAREAAATARERARSAAQKLADGQQQHEQMSGLESDVRHTARVAELLGDFRNTVVASVGPRLAVQAAELFGELTDHEYDRLEVDPDTFQLQISDGGLLYGLDRFSGSEIDLANLALRVAISEHIHFQSGGSIGLLVLDEVFGPLDEDRKARMLLALERLKGRFRQVLVVTHDNEIKEQLPNAIEVIKLPGRRATARVVGD